MQESVTRENFIVYVTYKKSSHNATVKLLKVKTLYLTVVVVDDDDDDDHHHHALQ